MTLYQLKPRFQQLLRPLVRQLYARGATANQLTLAAALGSLLLGLALAALAAAGQPRWFVLLPLWMLLRMALNAMDGMLAREFAQRSPLGAYLNELGDVLSDAALILPFALLPGMGVAGVALVCSVALLAALSEMAGVLGATIGASRRYDGPMGKSDRALVFGALGLLTGGLGWQPFWPTVVTLLLVLVALLLVRTCYRRTRAALREAAARTPTR